MVACISVTISFHNFVLFFIIEKNKKTKKMKKKLKKNKKAIKKQKTRQRKQQWE